MEVDAIAATLRIARLDEELCLRPAGLALEILDGPDAGLHDVDGQEITAGRGALCDITLRDPSVSEFHFRLAVGTDDVQLEDLGSSNGLWIGRARVERAQLLPGARFRAGAVRMQLRAIATAPAAVALHHDFHGLRGCSPAMRSIFALLSRAAPTPLPVLVTGETGVGKGMLARALHRASGRPGPLVSVDCTALPRELADGLLFGHVKGSFTGATVDRASPFERADGGTLFLDEIGELPLELQPKLLRALDEQVVQRLGAPDPRAVDVRLVAATNRHLVQEVSAGRFRSDLYHRLAGFAIRIPPLRSRREDIPFLAAVFLDEIRAKQGLVRELGDEVAAELLRGDWPGNVRQLRQTVLRAAYLGDGPELSVSDLLLHDDDPNDAPALLEAPALAAPDASRALAPLQPLVDEFKRDYCRSLLARSSTIAEAAKAAGFSARGFRLLLKRLDLDPHRHIGK